MLEISPIHEVAKAFKSCCDLLGCPITPYECESFGRFFTLAYGTENRAFHHLNHALEVSKNCSPAGRIAAFFHDVVYKQVDQAKLPEINSLFGVFDPAHALELKIPEASVLSVDPWRWAIVAIFDVKPGQIIAPNSGMNEFLSAWTAIQKLSCILSREQILHVIACIEATIPFRGAEVNPSVSEKLKLKVAAAAKILKLKFTDAQLDFIIEDSVKISNNDIQGFTRAPETFIHDSWALLYESNPALQNAFHTLQDLRVPLAKHAKFLSTLKPEKIFIRYGELPSDEEMTDFLAQTAKNLALGYRYIQAKYLDAAILEAFAGISGGDGPLSLFSGLHARVDDHIKHCIPKAHTHKKDDRVRALLANERVFKSDFALETTLFGTLVYDSLTDSETEHAHLLAEDFAAGSLSAESFLRALPKDLVVTIGEILKGFLWTRRELLQAFLESLNQPKKAA